MTGKIASFETMGLVDGPGVRFVVFMQGCPLRCAYCHNPEMWKMSDYKYEMTAQELVDKVKKYRTYFGEQGGVTVSGGEPLLQKEFVTEFFKLCKDNSIHTCLDTSGFGENYEELLDYCDLIILDVKELDSEKYTALVDQKIDKFFKFVEVCQKKSKKLWLRQVLVPGYNDTEENVFKLKAFAKGLKNVEKVELLPFHNMAKSKYEKLGIDYKLKNFQEMDKEKCKKLEKLLK